MIDLEAAMEIQTHLGSGCDVSPSGSGLEVRTPLQYPNQDNIYVFVHEKDGRIIVTDGGDTIYKYRLSDDPDYLWARRICGTFSVTFDHPDILRDHVHLSAVPQVVMDVAMAAMTLAYIAWSSAPETEEE